MAREKVVTHQYEQKETSYVQTATPTTRTAAAPTAAAGARLLQPEQVQRSVYAAQQRNTAQRPLGLILLRSQAECSDKVEALTRLHTIARALIDPATLLVLQSTACTAAAQHAHHIDLHFSLCRRPTS